MEGKPQLRQVMRAYRDKMDHEVRESHSQQITEKILARPEFLTAQTFFVYVSFRSEVQTHNLINRLLQCDKRVCVPFIDSKDQMQAVRFDGWNDMQPDRFGFLVPRNIVPETNAIEISIVPGLAFTRQGLRLGYGKGHYDRFFSAQSGGVKWGLAFDCQIVDQIPIEPFDYAMDYVVTERQTLSARV